MFPMRRVNPTPGTIFPNTTWFITSSDTPPNPTRPWMANKAPSSVDKLSKNSCDKLPRSPPDMVMPSLKDLTCKEQMQMQ